jgi:signal transduction histidine kinase
MLARAPFGLLILAAVVTADYGGIRPALVAVALGIGALYWLVPLQPLPFPQGLIEPAIITGLAGLFIWIVSRKRDAEIALRRSEFHRRTVVTQLPLILWATDTSGRLTLCEGRGLAQLGERTGTVGPLSLEEIGALSPRGADNVRRALAGELVVDELAVGDRVLDAWYTPVYDERRAISGTVGLALDITDRRALEEQLRQAQKMEAVGRLAGGVAHDFNNLVMAISGFSELMLMELPADDSKRQPLEAIQQAAARAAALTRRLLAFGRRQVLRPRLVDLNDVVRRIDPLLRRVIEEHITLDVRLAPEAAILLVDPSQVEQVILNLAVNARDAMPSGGRLTITTANITVAGNADPSQAIGLPGRYVTLEVADTGAGIDADTREHLFEPFFTTMAPGHGTGLGLATVYGIVKQSGGAIEVHSEPRRGATFTVVFPRHDGVPEPVDAEPPATFEAVGSERVLLVEDDPNVSHVVAETLRRSGYRVATAASGEEAIDWLAADDGPLDVLITDVVLPGLGGSEVSRRVRSLRPGVGVLYMSGYAREVVIQRGLLPPESPFVQKPVAPRELAHQVRQVLMNLQSAL